MNGVLDAARRGRRHVRFALSLRVLPRPVACFCWRAYRHAQRTGDRFSSASAARPAELASLLALFRAWSNALAPGAVVAFHDFGHPDYPGVREAIADLGLRGEERGGLFVWRAP